MGKVLFIVNPVSGRGRAKTIAPKLTESLRELGYPTEVYFTAEKGDATRKAATIDDSVSLVVGVGGDGTLNEIVNGLTKKIPTTLFPLGTANVMALELDLPRAVSEFAAFVKSAKIKEIDLIRANGRLGFFALGVGFDGMVIEELQRRRHGPIRKSSYIPIVLKCIRHYKTPSLRVEVDGKTYENIAFALIANTKHYGGSVFELSQDRKLDDGLYECYLFQGRGRGALAKYLFRGLTNRLLQEGDPIQLKGKKIRVESQIPDRQIPYEIDGDFGGTTPVNIEVLPKTLQILKK